MKYPVQVITTDSAVLHCLRALAFFSQTGSKHGIVAGVTDESWQANGEVVTFCFNDPTSREVFLHEVDRILPTELYATQVIEEEEAPRISA